MTASLLGCLFVCLCGCLFLVCLFVCLFVCCLFVCWVVCLFVCLFVGCWVGCLFVLFVYVVCLCCLFVCLFVSYRTENEILAAQIFILSTYFLVQFNGVCCILTEKPDTLPLTSHLGHYTKYYFTCWGSRHGHDLSQHKLRADLKK